MSWSAWARERLEKSTRQGTRRRRTVATTCQSRTWHALSVSTSSEKQELVAVKQIKLGAKSWDEACKSTELAALRQSASQFYRSLFVQLAQSSRVQQIAATFSKTSQQPDSNLSQTGRPRVSSTTVESQKQAGCIRQASDTANKMTSRLPAV